MDTQLINNIIFTSKFFWQSMATSTYNKNGLFAWTTNLKANYLNGVINTAANITQEDVEEVIHFFKNHDVPWLWIVNPIYDGENVTKLLLSKGFRENGSYSVVCYDLTENLPELDLKQTYIREVFDEKGLMDWRVPEDEGFKVDKNEQLGYFDRVKNVLFGKEEAFHHYVAYINEKPVSCATLSFSEHGARIDNVATCDDFLRQGFAKAVTMFAMKEAKKLGCKMVCLESSDAGLSLYLKLGFKEIYKNREYAFAHTTPHL